MMSMGALKGSRERASCESAQSTAKFATRCLARAGAPDWPHRRHWIFNVTARSSAIVCWQKDVSGASASQAHGSSPVKCFARRLASMSPRFFHRQVRSRGHSRREACDRLTQSQAKDPVPGNPVMWSVRRAAELLRDL